VVLGTLGYSKATFDTSFRSSRLLKLICCVLRELASGVRKASRGRSVDVADGVFEVLCGLSTD